MNLPVDSNESAGGFMAFYLMQIEPLSVCVPTGEYYMSILRAGGQTIVKAFSATERVVEVVDNIAHMATNVTGAGVEISEIWGDDMRKTSLLSAEGRRLNREDELNVLRARIAAGIPADDPMEGEAGQ